MSATIEQIKDEALKIIGEVSGAGVQTYSEDRIMGDVIRSFNLLFKKRWWEQYTEWFRVELDGTTGLSTTGVFAQVLDFEDFASVHRDTETHPLPILSKKINIYALPTSAEVMFWNSLPASHANYVTHKLQFYPVTAEGFVNILARVYPIDLQNDVAWDWEDTMYMDKDMLAYGTAFMTLNSDDTNANGAELARTMMEDRYSSIVNALGNHPIPIRGSSSIPNNWFVQQ